jgi:hypothetical protein
MLEKQTTDGILETELKREPETVPHLRQRRQEG